MTPQQIIGVGIRLVAIMIALASVSYFTVRPRDLPPGSFSDAAIYFYLAGAAYLLFAAALWFFPMALAHRIVPRTRFENRLNLQALEAARVGCSLIGLWVIVKTMPHAVWFVLNLFLYSGQESMFHNLDTNARIDLLSMLFKLAMGLVLIFRSGDFAAAVVRDKVSRAGD